MAWSQEAWDAGTDPAWRAAVRASLRGANPADLLARTPDGVPLRPLYPPDHTARPSAPHPAPLTVVQRLDGDDPDAAARQALVDLTNGAGGLALVAEGSRMARTSPGLGARGRGRGVDGLAALDGVVLDAVELRVEPRGSGLDRGDLPARLLDLAGRRGHAPSSLRLDLGLDPLGAMAASGLADEGWRARLAAWLAPHFEAGSPARLMRADGRIYHDGGATPGQELAAVLATMVAYLRTVEAAHLPLEAARGALSVTLSADADLLQSAAKLRALRRLWARVEASCGLAPRPMPLHVETSWRMMTRLDPATNTIRTTLAAAAAVLGGADSLTVLPAGLALGPPDGAARRLAGLAPLVLVEEAQLRRVADPLLGSGAVEAWTDGLVEAGWAGFEAIEREGGLAASLREGHVQARIAASRAALEQAVAEGRLAIVGTTLSRAEGEALPPPPHVASSARAIRPMRLAQAHEGPTA